MTKKLLAVLVAATLPIVGLVPPVAAHVENLVIRGHDFSSDPNLTLYGDTCAGGGTFPEATKYYLRDGTVGTHSIGWQHTTTGYEVGPAAWTPEASSISLFQVDLYAPSGAASGHVLARFYADSGVYVGWDEFGEQWTGWKTFQLAQTVFAWTFYEEGQPPVSYGTGTVADFALADAGGVDLGLLLGCDGEQFFVDNLRVGGPLHGSTYDFEGKESTAHLEFSTDGKTVRERRAFVARHGQSFWMLGHSHGHGDDGNPDWYTGPGTLWAKPFGSPTFRAVKTKPFNFEYYASYKVTPQKRTVYRFTTPGSHVYDSSSSGTVTVSVRAAIRAEVQDRRLIEGQRLTISGRIFPGNKGVRVKLQRKSGGWKTIATSRTRNKGAFTVGARVGTPGTWKVRVLVEAGKGNLGTTTRTRTVEVKRYIPPEPPEKVVVETAPASTVSGDPPEPDRNAPSGRLLRTAAAYGTTPATGCLACPPPDKRA